MRQLFLLGILFLSLITGEVFADPCVFEKDRLYRHADVFKCFLSVPFNTTVRDQTLDVLQAAYQLFAFLDIAVNPPDPQHFNPPVDLMATFQSLRTMSFATDYDFHNYLRGVYIQLHDAHTMYYAPACYASWDFYQPLNLVGYVDSSSSSSGQLAIGVSPYFETGVYNYYKDQGIDLLDFVGAQVLTINAVEAVQYITTFSHDSVGSSKDPGVRFNIALTIPSPYDNSYYPAGRGAWLGLFSQRESHFLPPPAAAEESIVYRFKLTNGSLINITFPWLARSSVAYSSFDDFMSAYYNADATSSPTGPTGSDSAAARTKTYRRTNGKVVSFGRHKAAELAETSVPIVPIRTSIVGGAGAYHVGNDTLVLYLNTFEPNDYVEFASVITDGYLYAYGKGLTRLLIDLTDNGGGDICLGRATLNFMFPDQQDWGPTDMPRSPLADNLTMTAINHQIPDTEWSPSFYQNMQDVQYPPDDPNWLIPGIPHVRGGLLRNYSQLIHISSDSEECGAIPFKNLAPFAPENMLIMDYGFCGSTCALFADHAHNYEGVRTVAVGGFTGQQQQYSSFPGLEVLETPSFYWILNTLLQQTGDLSCKTCTAPRNLITSAGYRMCIREIYGPQPAMPLEYTWQPATYRHPLSYNTAVHHEQLWPEMLQYF